MRPVDMNKAGSNYAVALFVSNDTVGMKQTKGENSSVAHGEATADRNYKQQRHTDAIILESKGFDYVHFASS